MAGDVLREVVLPRLERVKKSGGGFMARCPAHEDGTASLSVSEGKDHPVVLFCHAGCDKDDVLKGLGLEWADLSKPREPDARDWQPRQVGGLTGHARWAATYDYLDENGDLLFQVLRSHDKKFLQRRRDPAGKDGWTWKLGETRRVLYRLPKVVEAVKAGKLIFICEGEKDVHTCEQAGLVATCNPGGAGKWKPEFAEVLREAVVTIVADRDDPGQAHARQVRDSLVGVASYVEIAEAVEGKDATDHVNAGHSLADLTVTWTSEKPAKVDLAPDLWEFLAVDDAPFDWVIEGLIERGDRLILTGFEGLGKSQLQRQMAMTAAGGVHPFYQRRRIRPVRVLVVDCENSERQSRRKYGDLAKLATDLGCKPGPGMLRLIHRTEGVNLLQGGDAEWLMERVCAHKPDLLFVGPFYRLHNEDMRDEVAARRTVAVLDAVRAEGNCAMVIEAHAGHGEAGKHRSVRPTGSSLLLRWPEFGFGLAPASEPKVGEPCIDVEIRHWRGQRDIREWPSRLTWGGPGNWPWIIPTFTPPPPT